MIQGSGVTDRGFPIYSSVTDRYNSSVSVQKSSLATEDCVWIFAINDTIEEPAPHLTVEQAKVIRDGLNEFIRLYDKGELL